MNAWLNLVTEYFYLSTSLLNRSSRRCWHCCLQLHVNSDHIVIAVPFSAHRRQQSFICSSGDVCFLSSHLRPPSWTCQQHLWAQSWNHSRNKPTDSVECFCSRLFRSVGSVVFLQRHSWKWQKGVKVSAHLRAGWLGDEKLDSLLKDTWGFGKWCSLEICEHQRSICTQGCRILQ